MKMKSPSDKAARPPSYVDCMICPKRWVQAKKTPKRKGRRIGKLERAHWEYKRAGLDHDWRPKAGIDPYMWRYVCEAGHSTFEVSVSHTPYIEIIRPSASPAPGILPPAAPVAPPPPPPAAKAKAIAKRPKLRKAKRS